MLKIQSKDNIFTKGYLNVNILKMVFAVLLYFAVEIPLCFLWYTIVGSGIAFKIYSGCVIAFTAFLMYNWIVMWWRLPKHYRKELEDLYKAKLKNQEKEQI